MHDDIKRLFELLNVDYMNNILAKYDIDFEYLLTNYDEFVSKYKDIIYKEYFSFLDKYKDNSEFFQILTKENDYEQLLLLKFFAPSEIYYKAIDFYYDGKSIDDVQGFVLDDEDLNYFLGKNFDLKDIIEYFEIVPAIQMRVFTEHPELIDILIESTSYPDASMIAAAISNGSFVGLDKYFAQYGTFEEHLKKLLEELLKFDSFDYNRFFDEILTKYLDKSDISVLEDNQLVEKLINIGGSSALIFAKSPTLELIEMTDFSYGDYILYDGSYKNSPDLLMNFLNKGKVDALMYAKSGAINDDVINFIRDNNISLDRLKSYDNILDSLTMVKYFVENNDYSLVSKLSTITTDLDSFDFVYDLVSTGKYTLNTDYSSSNGAKFLEHFINHDWSNLYLYNLEITYPVALRLIELGLTVDDYVVHLSNHSQLRSIAEAFAFKGEYIPLFFVFDNDLLDKYIDELTYDLYLSALAKSKSDNIHLSIKLLSKFVKEGHYDVLKDNGSSVYSSNLASFGFDTLTYEEYLKLPDYVQEIPALKEKFLEYNDSYLIDLLATNATSEVVEKVALNGMAYDKLVSYFKEDRFAPEFTAKTVKHYLEQGELSVVFRLKYSVEPEELNEIVELYYKLSNGVLPSFENVYSNNFRNALVKKYLDIGKFEALETISYFDDGLVDIIIASSYDFETFKKYPVFNEKVISKFLTLDKEDELVKIFSEEMEKRHYISFKGIELLFVKMYKLGFSKESLNRISKIFNINVIDVFKMLNTDDYSIFNCFDFSSFSGNKHFFNKIVGYLDVESVKKLLSGYYLDSDTKLMIIRKMVDLGHYDFVSYYSDKIEESVLKKAILCGYFPEKEINNNKFFKLFLDKIEFSLEEKGYLKSKIDSDVRYVYFLPELMEDYELLLSYIKKNTNLIKLLDDNKKKDVNLLRLVVKDDPQLCAEILTKDISPADLASLILDNTELIKYLNKYFINIEVVTAVVKNYPNIIDYYLYNVPDDLVKEAIASGYVFSSNSSIEYIRVALENGIEVDYSIIKNFKVSSLLGLANSLIKDVDSELTTLFKRLFDEFCKEDYYEFVYEVVLFFNSRSYFLNDPFKEFIASLGIDVSKYSNCNKNSKELFILSIKLNDLPKDDSAALLLDDIISDTDDIEFVVEWLFINYRYFDEVIAKARKMASDHFLEKPLFYVKYVDVNDPEIVKLAKGIIFEYPELYKSVPLILDDKELILDLIEITNGDVYYYLSNEFKNDLEILEAALKKNEDVCYYVNVDDPNVLDFIKNHVMEYPIFISRVPNLITDKESALKLIHYRDGFIYSYLPDDLKNDFDICSAVLEFSARKIFDFPSTMPDFKKLVIKALEKDGTIILSISSVITLDEDIVISAIKTYPAALFNVPIEFITETTYGYITDITKIGYLDMNLPAILKIIHFSNFDLNNYDVCSFVVDYILSNLSLDVSLDKNDSVLKTLFTNVFGSKDYKLTGSDGAKFRNIVAALPFLDISIFNDELQVILRDTMTILNSTGKLNTLEKNPVFNYDVVKYIYPLFGLSFVKDVIKYNTKAASVIVDEIKMGESNLLQEYYNIICKYDIFAEDDKRVHYAFRDFGQIKPLIKDIVDNKIQLTETDILNLRKIIVSRNLYSINSYEQLVKYNERTQLFWTQKLNTDSISDIKNVLSTLFGYNSVNALTSDFNNFQLDNYLNIKTIRDDLILQYGKERALEIFKECFYTKKEVSIITLMSRIIRSENINELKELMSKLLKGSDGALDYCDEVREIIRKVRLLYNYQFNGRLTKIDSIKSKRLEKDDPSNPYGVTIIEMDSEKFNFLAHRIYSYDGAMRGFSSRLMADPSLWTKLEGASTLSTSSFSDKGFWFIDNRDNTGVVYLFNDLPNEFMLFMNGRDLYVEHGGYKIEPTANLNAFTNIDALNQCSCYKHCKYNEVAGFREGMLPCAFACVGDVPNEATIRAAKYFSDYLGVDIPIIKFNIPAYESKKQSDYENAKREFEANPNYNAMYNIFLDGIPEYHPEKSIHDKIDFCLNILNTKYQNNEIDLNKFYTHLFEMESIVSQIIVDLPDVKKELSRIGIFRRSIMLLKRQTMEDIVRLETASMGESGIMYKFIEGESTYLVKPAVDKKSFSSQSFRADVQEAAFKLQDFLSPATSVRVESIDGRLKLSKQEMITVSEENSNALVDWVNNGGTLDYQYSSSLLREYVVDFLLCNFDCYVGNFIIDSSNQVRGIDKEQSFRFINNPDSLKADFSYIPNGNHRIPIYYILFDRYKRGEIDLDLSVITDTIEKVKLLTDEEYKAFFEKYAVSLDKYRSQEILKAILDRRDAAIEKMEDFVEELQNIKSVEGVSL